jgi:hypothetical protein
MHYFSEFFMVLDALMTLQFYVRLHFAQSNESGNASKIMTVILNIYYTELYNPSFKPQLQNPWTKCISEY